MFTENGLNTFECSHAFAVSVRKAVKENQEGYTQTADKLWWGWKLSTPTKTADKLWWG